MGLSIHYSFNAGDRSAAEIFDILENLRSQTQKLAFHEVDALIAHLNGEDFKLSQEQNSLVFLPLAASQFNPITLEKQVPEQIIGFMALPRLGSEALPIFLAQYSGNHEWIASGHCKTMFAGLPEYGGTANFVLAHIMVIEILDQAKRMGIVKSVFDESGYWEERDILRLVDKSELLMLSSEVMQQAESIPTDFVSALVEQIESAAM